MKQSLVRLNGDRVLALVLIALGVVALVLGWFGISGKALAVQQLPYLVSGGLGGVVLVAVGCTIAISADLQDEWRQMDRVEAHLSTLVERDGADGDVEAEAPSTNGQTRVRARSRA